MKMNYVKIRYNLKQVFIIYIYDTLVYKKAIKWFYVLNKNSQWNLPLVATLIFIETMRNNQRIQYKQVHLYVKKIFNLFHLEFICTYKVKKVHN